MFKKQSDVLGNKINCPNFCLCPVCYACRNYNSADVLCSSCSSDHKFNICNKKIHKSKPISRLIKRTVIKLEE